MLWRLDWRSFARTAEDAPLLDLDHHGVRASVAEALQANGTRHVLICTYANDYMGYVTTNEEYQEQCYEGGHTIFGQWTLAAFQTRFAALAREMLKPEAERQHDRTTRPPRISADELAKRTDLPVPN